MASSPLSPRFRSRFFRPVSRSGKRKVIHNVQLLAIYIFEKKIGSTGFRF